MKYIDVHCHLTGGEYGDLDALLKKAEDVGVKKIITAGYDLSSSEQGARLSERYDIVYFTAGFHPTELKKYREGDLDVIASLLKHKKCVALGETGLDYHYEDTDKPLQNEIFLRQLELAHSAGIPVQIHSRDCAEDMYKVLSANRSLLTCGALMHCYSHSAELAVEFEKIGLSFSFGGTSTYKGSKRAQKSIRALSQNSLLTETDSPYLPPVSRHGTFPNTPESIPEILANIASIRGERQDELAQAVWQNAHRLFKKLES